MAKRRSSPRNAAAGGLSKPKRGKPRDTQRAAPVRVRLLNRDSERGEKIYGHLHKLVEDHHPQLIPADIAIYWADWKQRPDGGVRLSQAKRASDEDRAGRQAGGDFRLLLNAELFEKQGVATVQQLHYAIDSALCSMRPAVDSKTGEQKENEAGKLVWRIARPDAEIYLGAYERWGPVFQSVAKLRQTVVQRAEQDRPLLALLDMEPVEAPAPTARDLEDQEAQRVADAIFR